MVAQYSPGWRQRGAKLPSPTASEHGPKSRARHGSYSGDIRFRPAAMARHFPFRFT